MSSRSTKRRRVDIRGKQIETKKDILSTLQQTDINSSSSSSYSGYYLRSSKRNSRKRKFISPIKENEVKTNVSIKKSNNDKEKNNKTTTTKTTTTTNSKLSKLRESITSAFNKLTNHKENNDKENLEKENKTITTTLKKQQTQKKKVTEKKNKNDDNGNNDKDKKNEKIKNKNKNKYEYDDKGYIIFHKGLLMNNRYIVQRRLGKGTFSKVFACRDIKECQDKDTEKNQKKAIKVIRNQHKYQIAARTELRILEYLKTNDPDDKYNVIKLIESSYFQMHPMFVFPLYGRSLYHYLYDNNFRPFPDSHIRLISKQIISAVNYVHCLGIIITDLKPENIIICNDSSDRHILGDDSIYYTLKSTKVRLIDFGSAVFDGPSNCVHQHLIQTRHYRAPEVMFKFNWSYPADIWSIGCVIVELSNGKMLFNTHDTIDHLNQIITAIGQIPNNLIQLIEENVYNELFHFNGKLALHRAKISSVQCNKLKSYFHAKYHKNIYHLVKSMLDWNPETRITAQNALKHPLFLNE